MQDTGARSRARTPAAPAATADEFRGEVARSLGRQLLSLEARAASADDRTRACVEAVREAFDAIPAAKWPTGDGFMAVEALLRALHAIGDHLARPAGHCLELAWLHVGEAQRSMQHMQLRHVNASGGRKPGGRAAPKRERVLAYLAQNPGAKEVVVADACDASERFVREVKRSVRSRSAASS